MRSLFTTLILLFLIATPFAAADQSLFYKEVNLIGGYSDRDKWVDKTSDMPSSLGFEYYRKFSNEYGDYLTADLQMRVAYDSSKSMDEAWGVEFHNAWLEYKLMPQLKIRGGHFSPSFGLEPIVDTHGTLLQTLAMDDIGFKLDWGAGFRGFISKLDYEVAMQLGSGMSIRWEDDGNYLASARIGLAQNENPQVGFSLLWGEVLETEGMSTLPRNKLLSSDPIRKTRVGLDGQYLYGPLLFKAEVAYGKNDNDYVFGYLGEIDFTIPKYQNVELELQFKSWINDLDMRGSDNTTLTAGVSYKLSQSITLRTAYSHDFNMMNKKEENKIIAQFYFYGK